MINYIFYFIFRSAIMPACQHEILRTLFFLKSVCCCVAVVCAPVAAPYRTSFSSSYYILYFCSVMNGSYMYSYLLQCCSCSIPQYRILSCNNDTNIHIILLYCILILKYIIYIQDIHVIYIYTY